MGGSTHELSTVTDVFRLPSTVITVSRGLSTQERNSERGTKCLDIDDVRLCFLVLSVGHSPLNWTRPEEQVLRRRVIRKRLT